MSSRISESIEIQGSKPKDLSSVLTEEALEFLIALHRKFNPQRLSLLKQREEVQKNLNEGKEPDFLSETKEIRENGDWKVAEIPKDLKQRRVEITGPTDRKMVINALNSGADIFMADFEDANSPFWENMIEGQANLRDAVRKSISLVTPEGKEYRLKEKHAVLFVRPRGWHLDEKHLKVDGQEISGSLFDFGLYFFHNAAELLKRGTGPYFYLPKLESHKEARLWNEVFLFSQEYLKIPRGTIRATVLIETILATFEMEEILYELREHSAGLNAGRWDYIFSMIKKFRRRPFTFPDRSQITMTVPCMRAYTELLVKTCHKRGAHAMGGMAAFIPNRKDPDVTEKALAKVKEDKLREAGDGFDGTWVAHPDLVPVAKEIFDDYLKEKPNQIDRKRDEVEVNQKELLNFAIPKGTITEEGLRLNINVGLQYLASWLRGTGAAAIYNLMEDAATAEISRAQVWQWLTQSAKLENDTPISKDLVQQWTLQELKKIEELYGEHFDPKNFVLAKKLFETLIFAEHFIEFLTLPAYKEIP